MNLLSQEPKLKKIFKQLGGDCIYCEQTFRNPAALRKHYGSCPIYLQRKCIAIPGKYITTRKNEKCLDIANKLGIIFVADLININKLRYPGLTQKSSLLIGTILLIPATAFNLELIQTRPMTPTTSQLRPLTPPTAKATMSRALEHTLFSVGDLIEAKYEEVWYLGKILARPCPRTFFLWEVVYEIDSTFNQVELSDIRPRTTANFKESSFNNVATYETEDYCSKTMNDNDREQLVNISKSLQDFTTSSLTVLNCSQALDRLIENVETDTPPLDLLEAVRSRLEFEKLNMLNNYLKQEVQEEDHHPANVIFQQKDDTSGLAYTPVVVDPGMYEYLNKAFGVDGGKLFGKGRALKVPNMF